jgi:(p)ppGpp synthase/HD superfamily hydrolase
MAEAKPHPSSGSSVLAGWTALAQWIATRAHHGQQRKDGAPYIIHPAAVAAAVPDELKPIAWLHDVVEDSAITLDDLSAAGLPDYVVAAVGALTKQDQEDYGRYLERVCANEHARVVKIADVTHNLATTPSGKNRVKYTHALEKLRASAPRG